jgi:hypothetical protein
MGVSATAFADGDTDSERSALVADFIDLVKGTGNEDFRVLQPGKIAAAIMASIEIEMAILNE